LEAWLLHAFDALDASVRESANTPTGRLKISAPGSFGTAVFSRPVGVLALSRTLASSASKASSRFFTRS
jgi:hypothetical protein